MTLCRLASVWLFVVLLAGPRLAAAFDPSQGDFSKLSPEHVRLVEWNVEKHFISTPADDPVFERLLRALRPDIVVFEEIDAAITYTQIQARLDVILPLEAGQHWSVQVGLSDGYNRNAVASRWPQSLRRTDTVPSAGTRGVTAVLIDAPDTTYTKDLYVMGVHLKAYAGGTNTASRQKSCDALAKWFGDIRTAGGSINLAADTPALVTGDFNLVDPEPQQPEVTLRTGDIIDNATFGSDIKGDWDATDLTDLRPADAYTSSTQTWPSDTTSPSSRLDRLYFTDACLTIPNCFVFNTLTIPPEKLSSVGVSSTDTQTVSDHLPTVADLALPLVGTPVHVSAFALE